MAATPAEIKIPFLRSCRNEVADPVPGQITGKIPKWLRGSLVRIGAGLLYIGTDNYAHAFDGLAMVRKFCIKEEEVTYQNRFLRSDTYKQNMQANKIVVNEFGTCSTLNQSKSIFEKLYKFFQTQDFTDNGLFNIVKYDEEYYACNDSSYIWRIDIDSLESQEKVDLREFIPLMVCTVHPHTDRNGSIFNIGSTTSGMNASYTLLEFPPKIEGQENIFEGVRVIGRIPISKYLAPSYYHSFAMTANYFIFVEQPMVLSVPKLVVRQFATTITYEECLEWQPQYQIRFHVMKRGDGSTLKARYTADPFMLFHHINAYEDGHHIVLDICCHEDGNVLKALHVDALKDYAEGSSDTPLIECKALPKRFVIPLRVNERKENLVNLKYSKSMAFSKPDGTVHCIPEPLCDIDWFIELPIINYRRYNGMKYRYFYAVGKKVDCKDICSVKIDVQDHKIVTWTEDGVIPSEPIFVPKEKCAKEDDGILLISLLYNYDDKKVSLLILDAVNMKEMARATFQVQSSVPGDFHGIFIPQPIS